MPNLDDAVMRPGGLRLLRKYLEVVADDKALAAPASQRLIVNHLYDLAALALGATCGRDTMMRVRSLTTLCLFGAAAVVALKYPLVGLGICICCLIGYLRPETHREGTEK